MLLPTASPYLSLLFRPSRCTLIVRWLRETTLEELQNGYWTVLVLAQSQGARRWLMDVRRDPKLSSEASAWLGETFLPTAAARLAPGRLHIAFLTNDRASAEQCQDEHLADEAIEELAKNATSTRVDVDETAALSWLLAQP